MSDLIVGGTTIGMHANQKAILIANKAIKLLATPADSYRLANVDEMYGESGSPIRAPEVLYSVMAALARATLA